MLLIQGPHTSTQVHLRRSEDGKSRPIIATMEGFIRKDVAYLATRPFPLPLPSCILEGPTHVQGDVGGGPDGEVDCTAPVVQYIHARQAPQQEGGARGQAERARHQGLGGQQLRGRTRAGVRIWYPRLMPIAYCIYLIHNFRRVSTSGDALTLALALLRCAPGMTYDHSHMK